MNVDSSIMDVEYHVNKMIKNRSGTDSWLDYITKLKGNHTDRCLLSQVYIYAIDNLPEEASVGYKKILIGLANLQSENSAEKARELYLNAKALDYDCAVVRVYHAQFEYLKQNKLEAVQILATAKKEGCQPRSLTKKAFKNCKSNKPSLLDGIPDPWDKALFDDTETNPLPIKEEGKGREINKMSDTVKSKDDAKPKLYGGPVRSLKKKAAISTCATPKSKLKIKRDLLGDGKSHSEVFQRRGPTMSPFAVKYSPMVKRNLGMNFTDSVGVFSNIFEVSLGQTTPLATTSRSRANTSNEKDNNAFHSGSGSSDTSSSAIPSKDDIKKMLMSPHAYSPYYRSVGSFRSSSSSSSLKSCDRSKNNSESESISEASNKDQGSVSECATKDFNDVKELESVKECTALEEKGTSAISDSSSGLSVNDLSSTILEQQNHCNLSKTNRSTTDLFSSKYTSSQLRTIRCKLDDKANNSVNDSVKTKLNLTTGCLSSDVDNSSSSSSSTRAGNRWDMNILELSRSSRVSGKSSSTTTKDLSLKIDFDRSVHSSDYHENKVVDTRESTDKENHMENQDLQEKQVTDRSKGEVKVKFSEESKENVIPYEKIYCVKKIEYKKVKEIGTGGSCKVFEVRTSEGKKYALKKVNLSDIDETILLMHQNEITFLEKMKGNRHIIRLHDWELINTYLFLILEKGDCDLAHLLKRKKSISMEEMKMYWQQMVEAVKTIHENGIVHADLKPANFLLVGDMLKLIDFGIANGIQDNRTSATRMCQMGTLNYMSPEVLDQDSCRISKAADIWSLGCILYYMTYKKTPYSHIKNQFSRTIALQSGAEINFQGISDLLLKNCLQGCLKYKKEERLNIQQLLDHPFLTA